MWGGGGECVCGGGGVNVCVCGGGGGGVPMSHDDYKNW